MPACDFGAHGQIKVFTERIARPAACGIDGSAAPDGASAVKLKQPAGAKTGGLLDNEMGIEHEALGPCQPIRSVICKFTPRLDEARIRIGDESGDHFAQPVRWRAEVCVEYGNERRIGLREARGEGARFVSAPPRAEKVQDIDTVPP